MSGTLFAARCSSPGRKRSPEKKDNRCPVEQTLAQAMERVAQGQRAAHDATEHQGQVERRLQRLERELSAR